MITLIGTGHVFDLSQPLLNIFEEKKPETICVELDQERYNSMILKQTNPEKYEKSRKNAPAIYKLLAKFQDNMADEYGVVAGQEMLTAINYAQSHQLPLKFVDMNAQELFNRMLRSMSFSEKIRLFFTGIAGLFISKKRVESEMQRFENDFDSYIDEVGKKYPTIKRVLIDERNQYMADQIILATEDHERVIVILGDGHVPGISRILKNANIVFESVRLADLRKQTSKNSDGVSASFSLEYKTSDDK